MTGAEPGAALPDPGAAAALGLGSAAGCSAGFSLSLSLVDQSLTSSLLCLCAPGYTLPKLYHKMYFSISAAIHSHYVRVRSRTNRRKRAPPQRFAPRREEKKPAEGAAAPAAAAPAAAAK